ncbi:hypothetical protein HanIR_Chr01g0026461 [Helianthus annuus]|nr:hypothetical protein HanIR_Chr01g0026461 [Helianthus annuus]
MLLPCLNLKTELELDSHTTDPLDSFTNLRHFICGGRWWVLIWGWWWRWVLITL